MKKITIFIAAIILALCFNPVCAQTVFGWEAATVVDVDGITHTEETAGGITLTFESSTSTDNYLNLGGYGGTLNQVGRRTAATTDPVTFTFSVPVDVESIIGLEDTGTVIDWTFSTPDGGGANADKTVSFLNGDAIASESPVVLNWVGVTTFTVTPSANSIMYFDQLTVSIPPAQTVFGWEAATVVNVDGVTHTEETANGITLTFESSTSTNTTNVGGYGGTVGQVGFRPDAITDPVTFTFSVPVDVESIIGLDDTGAVIDWTFSTPDGGGANADKTVSFLNGDYIASESPVVLNWVGVTTFTVTPSANSTMYFDQLTVSVSTDDGPLLFGWETAIQKTDNSGLNGAEHGYTEETIDGITLVFDSPEISPGNTGTGMTIINGGGAENLAGIRQGLIGVFDPVIFTFSEPVDIQSVIALEGNISNTEGGEWTFSTTDGDNADHIITFDGVSPIPNENPVVLNWVGVTSFKVSPSYSGSSLAFDQLYVSPSAGLSVASIDRFEQARVYPNPVENMLYIKNITGLKSVNVYNSLGQQVLQSKVDQIDVGHLSKGMYFLKIHSDQGTETKRIIKK